MVKTLLTLALLGATFPAQLGGSMRASAGGGGGESSAEAINVVIQWNRILLAIVRTPGAQPATIHPTRSFAVTHAAIYDAVNAIDRTHKPYLVRLFAPRDASQEAAASSAAHDVLVTLYPALKSALDLDLQQSLAQIPDGQDKTGGIRVGQAVASRILALRNSDGSNAQPIPYVFGNAPGDYQSTPRISPSSLSLRIGPALHLLPWSAPTSFVPALPRR